MAEIDVPRSRVGVVLDRLAALEARHRDLDFEHLRASVLTGRAGAWRLFVEKYSRYIYAVALRLLGATEDREDAAAAIYTRVLERVSAEHFRLLLRFQGRCRFTTYLFRIVQSEKKEFFARRRLQAPGADASLADTSIEPPVPVLQPDALRSAAHEALDRLAPEDRLVLLYRFRDGLKLREIVSLCGYKDVNAAAHALRRAVASLDVLKELREQGRLGEGEVEILRETLREELMRFDAVGDGGS